MNLLATCKLSSEEIEEFKIEKILENNLEKIRIKFSYPICVLRIVVGEYSTYIAIDNGGLKDHLEVFAPTKLQALQKFLSLSAIKQYLTITK